MERSERRESRGNSGAVTPQHSPPSIRQSKPLSSSGETHCLENKGSLGPPQHFNQPPHNWLWGGRPRYEFVLKRGLAIGSEAHKSDNRITTI